MENNTTPTLPSEEELPFFARFLVEQVTSAEGDDEPPSLPYTLKFPSDWEDR